MKKIIVIFILIMNTTNLNFCKNRLIELPTPKLKVELSEWDFFLKALIKVESNGNQYAVGTKNDVGILQITPIYVKEANRLQKDVTYTLEDRKSIEKSLEMFNIIQNYYNPNKDIDKAIKLHNPRAGKIYADKIKKEIFNLKTNIV